MTKEPIAPKIPKTVRSNNTDKLYSRKRQSLTLEELKNKYLNKNKATA